MFPIKEPPKCFVSVGFGAVTYVFQFILAVFLICLAFFIGNRFFLRSFFPFYVSLLRAFFAFVVFGLIFIILRCRRPSFLWNFLRCPPFAGAFGRAPLSPLLKYGSPEIGPHLWVKREVLAFLLCVLCPQGTISTSLALSPPGSSHTLRILFGVLKSARSFWLPFFLETVSVLTEGIRYVAPVCLLLGRLLHVFLVVFLLI